VLIVPEGPVVGLPWLALPVSTSRYLADEARVVRVLNAERDVLPERAAPAGHGLIAVGDPDFERDGGPAASAGAPMALRSRLWPCAGSQPLSLPPLPAARAEVEDIGRSWPAAQGRAQVLVGGLAGESRVKLEAPGHAVIHIATHGVVVEDTCGASVGAGTRGVGGVEPLTSDARVAGHRKSSAPAPRRTAAPWLGRRVWLALAGANRPPSETRDENEGLLTAEEVVTLDLRGTEWVVLSACHSGLAPAWAREGVLGMRRAFHMAGARAVIASQWSVADESTREWMDALYAARARGATRAAEAITEASRHVLAARRHSGRSTHPFYWAAFTATED
jgi:CHAT domain-containing protein